MRRYAQSLVETGMIALLVVVVVIATWKIFGNSSSKMLNMSSIKTASSASSSLDSLKQAIIDNISKLNKNNSDYINKRVETAGMLGELIAKYKSGDESLEEFLLEQIKALDSKSNPESCLEDPQSCMALMTVSDFEWSTPINQSNTYYGGKIPVSLSYSYSYVDNSGKLVKSSITQSAYVQKEQNESNEGKSYSSFFGSYMDSTFSDSAFTGAASDVQTNINSYLTGTNCVLSKSSSQDISFSSHKTY